MSMSINQTFFCFICTHLTAGEREVDQIKRNADVHEIHKRTIFHSVSALGLPKLIYDHESVFFSLLLTFLLKKKPVFDFYLSNFTLFSPLCRRIIWLGDLNYRLNLSYEKTRDLISKKEWSKLLEHDQVIITVVTVRIWISNMIFRK